MKKTHLRGTMMAPGFIMFPGVHFLKTTKLRSEEMKCLSLFLLFLVVLFPGMVYCEIPEITRVGQWGTGPYHDVSIKGNYAYCLADGKGLEIININNPARPGKVGELEFDNHESSIHVEGNYAYIAPGNGGLKIINVTNPASPQLVGELDTWARDVFVIGNYAYVLSYSQLVVVDISIPSKPTPVGVYCSEYDTDFCVIGNYVYLISSYYYEGVKIIDVSTPSSPVMVNYFKLSDLKFNRIFSTKKPVTVRANVAMSFIFWFNVLIRYTHTTGNKYVSVNQNGYWAWASVDAFTHMVQYLCLPFLFFDKDFAEKKNSNY
jgi:hypothetical protein